MKGADTPLKQIESGHEAEQDRLERADNELICSALLGWCRLTPDSEKCIWQKEPGAPSIPSTPAFITLGSCSLILEAFQKLGLDTAIFAHADGGWTVEVHELGISISVREGHLSTWGPRTIRLAALMAIHNLLREAEKRRGAPAYPDHGNASGNGAQAMPARPKSISD